MEKTTAGIHHITAIVGHPQENVDFYAGVLGLRLVKQTVNFDDPGTYHLYFGDEAGRPGTIITFFPWTNAYKGRIGAGQTGTTVYAVPPGALPFWENRLTGFNIKLKKTIRFGETYLAFEDPHGLQLEITERPEGSLSGWEFGAVPKEMAIKGFGGAVLLSRNPAETARLLEEVMGLTAAGTEGDYMRFQSSGEIGNIVDVKQTVMPDGTMGTGTVHHIAWRAADTAEQLAWQRHLADSGYGVTEVKDRNYFTSIYFREHGGILFEVATDTPGFLHDESLETLGRELMLPEQYEVYRGRLKQKLTPIQVRSLD